MDLLKHYGDTLAGASDMAAWIREVVGYGIRRPGSDAGHRIESWVASRLRYQGLDDVRAEPLDVPVWEPRSARLVAWPAGRSADAIELPAFALPYTQPSPGRDADLVALDPAAPGAVAGAIAVDTVDPVVLPGSLMREVATGRHDPTGELDDYQHLLPFGSRLGREVDAAVEQAASGYVGVLDMPWDTHDYYVPYDAVDRPLPAVWIDRSAGARLRDLLAGGRARGRIEVDASTRLGTTNNVIGTLPGASDEWVVIGTHHDAPWASAVEDASGIALVLAQAAFWARVPVRWRPHNLLFLVNGGHMAGGAGMSAFLAAHADLLDRVVLAIHLEHVAAATVVDEGRLVATGDPEVRWWFTSRDPGLERSVGAALKAENLHRSWVLPPDAFGEFPPTDGGVFHRHGVPLVDLLSAPAYLFDACDTLDKVHEPSLVPITRATVRIIDALTGRSAADLRAGSMPAEPAVPVEPAESTAPEADAAMAGS